MNSNFHDNLKPTRSGFTLIELLFVIAILAVLASVAAGVLGKAKKDAQISATRSRITQIEAIMLTVMEEQEVRRLPGNLRPFVGSDRVLAQNLNRRVAAALLLAEYPVAQVAANGEFMANPELGRLAPASSPVNPDLGLNFRGWAQGVNGFDSNGQTFVEFLDGTRTAEMAFWQSIASAGDPEFKEPGEYLFLILSRIDIDGISALESLGPNVVGDPDDDGHPDIVDAFGDSMQLRILQVAVDIGNPPVVPTLAGGDIWPDVADSEINWQQHNEFRIADGSDGQGLFVNVPQGYQFLDPVIPRSLGKIRFQVVSPRLEEFE